MLKRGTGSKASYSPYSTGQRVKKADSRTKKLDLLPNKANVWLKQVGGFPSMLLTNTVLLKEKTFSNPLWTRCKRSCHTLKTRLYATRLVLKLKPNSPFSKYYKLIRNGNEFPFI